ncbi:hypothetical protein KQX54_000777 [Cotesia glomerata]|uniref:Uncharacterized protein n=1 Tax=Cotesia glomerata TaxID=32391 RepID=A0AAV7HAG2_COTGL|nr:hypothetical protein KQX54_000777 [Cotesia glomerata]
MSAKSNETMLAQELVKLASYLSNPGRYPSASVPTPRSGSRNPPWRTRSSLRCQPRTERGKVACESATGSSGTSSRSFYREVTCNVKVVELSKYGVAIWESSSFMPA